MAIVHFHLGPHKTGSTAVGAFLRAHPGLIERDFGITPVVDEAVYASARALNSGDFTLAETHLSELAEICTGTETDCLISCEDFAGDLPGRTKIPQPYPNLADNIARIKSCFAVHDTRFYFFTRQPQDWIQSAYFQLQKHRARFGSLQDFQDFLHVEDLWEGVLTPIRDMLGPDLIELPYHEGPGFSAVTALLSAILGDAAIAIDPKLLPRRNPSASPEVVAVLEVINQASCSPHARKRARQWLLNERRAPPLSPDKIELPPWPPAQTRPGWLAPGLSALWDRVDQRLSKAVQPNLLPDPFCDLSRYRLRLVTAAEELPKVSRSDMRNQVQILSYRFRGLPETCLLLGLSISYLRRATDVTEHAAYVFHRLWHEEYAILLAALPTRWLISTFQTFLEHGANSAQRSAAASAFFYANMLKAYEAERALEGREAKAIYPHDAPVTKSGFRGLDRFKLGGTDLMLNTNALLLEQAAADDAVGRVIQEFLLRTRSAATIFSRMDQSRKALGVDNPQFANCWSFFEDPGG